MSLQDNKITQETNDTEIAEADNNDDMVNVDTFAQDNGEISFKVQEPPAPQHMWTKKDKRAVWIVAAVVTVLAIIFSFLFGSINIFDLFAQA